jgi:hypothetical protein
MKRSMSVLLSLLVIAALAACAPKGTPTPSVADLQATALANAQMQIALTAASVPTATPLPPTPMPTPIPAQPTAILQQQKVAPTQPVSVPVSSDTSTSSGNPCNGPLGRMKGPHAQVIFKNTTKGNLSLYLYIYETAFGCGVGNVTIAPLESVTTSVPKGCYDFYGWVNGPKNSTPAGTGCLNFNQTVIVGQDNVVFKDQIK